MYCGELKGLKGLARHEASCRAKIENAEQESAFVKRKAAEKRSQKAGKRK